MIKRTLYFGNPAYLSKKDQQLVVNMQEKDEEKTIPIEDIGVVILDHQQITITQGLLQTLIENNAAVISCDDTHHPLGLMMPLSSNTLQSARFKDQIDASEPLKKNLWAQTVKAKIINQGLMLKQYGKKVEQLRTLARRVTSGDTNNCEAQAAAIYWRELFGPDFNRERYGEPPNNLLNYGYAILRAIVARGLVSSGLMPTLGIHHRNQYNAYCLADDIMEPYRPFVDQLVKKMYDPVKSLTFLKLTTEHKKELLAIATVDIFFKKDRSPLMVGMQRTTSSLSRCYQQQQRNLEFPFLYET
ncbi:MAG: type II CRISPR-associated endonuclease Cas1 [Chitinophagales bacterium]